LLDSPLPEQPENGPENKQSSTNFFIPPGTGLGLSTLKKQEHNEQVYKDSLKIDSEKEALGQDWAAVRVAKQSESLVGKAAMSGVRTLNDLLTIPYYSGGDPEPLNIPGNEKRVSEWSNRSPPPSDYPFAFSTSSVLSPDNNKEKIGEETVAFSFAAQKYLFSAPSYASYLERLNEVRLREMVDDGTIPAGLTDLESWAGRAADLGLFMLSGELTIPIALAGGTARIGTMADLVYGSATARGTWQTSRLAQEATAQAAKMTRIGLFTRGAAVGAAELVLYEAAKAGLDPLDELTSYEFLDAALWGSLLGGSVNTVFGRKILRHYIEEGVAARQARGRYVHGDGETGWTYRWEAAPTTAKKRSLVSGQTYKPLAQKLEYFKDIFYGSQEAKISAIRGLRQLLAQESGQAGTGVGMPERNELVRLFYQLWNRFQDDRYAVSVAEGKRLQQLKSDGTVNFVAWANAKSGLQGLPVFTALEEITQRTGYGSVTFEVFRDVLEETSKIGQMVQEAVRFGTALDENLIRAGMAKIINKYVPETARISIYDETLQNFNLLSWSVQTARSGAIQGQSNVTGLTLGDIPQSTGFGSSLPFGLSDHLNQAAILLKHPNPAVRSIGFMVKHASRHLPLPQGATIGETGQMGLNKTLSKTIEAYQRGILAEATGGAEVSFTSRLDLLKARASDPLFVDRFNKQILQYLDTGAEVGLSPAAVRAAKEIREELRYFAEAAFKRGIPGFTSSTVLHYSPWLWRWERIQHLAKTAGGKEALKQLLLHSFGTAENGQRSVYLGRELYVFNDAPQAAEILAARLIDLSEHAARKPLTTVDDDLIDSLKTISSPLKEAQGSPTPFGKTRTLLDRDVSVPTSQDFLSLGRNSMSLGDLRETDIPFILKKYFTSMQGAINEADFLKEFSSLLIRSGIELKNSSGKPIQKFAGVQEVLGFLRSTAQQSGHSLGPTLVRGSVEERAINSLIGYLKFEPVVANPGIMDKLVGIGGLLSYLRFGGRFGLAGATETARITGTLGLASAIKQFPVLEEMLVNWRSMSITNRNASSMIQALTAPSVGRLLRLDRHASDVLPPSRTARGGIGGSGKLDVVGSRLAKVSDVYSDITLLPAITSFSQVWAGATLIQHLYDASSKAFRLKPAQLNLLGITEHQYNVLIDYVKRNGVVTDTFLGKRVISLGGTVDPAAETLLQNFTNRFINTKIQSVPTRGDFADHVFSWLGRALLQFKTFNLKGIDNFLLANTQRALHGDALAVGREYLNVAILSSIILTGRNYATLQAAKTAGADQKTLDALEENMSVSGIVKAAWIGPVESGISTYFIDSLWTTFVDPDPLFANAFTYSGSRKGGWTDILGPSGRIASGAAETAVNAIEAMMHGLAPSWPMGAEWTATEQRKAEQTFLPNLLGVKEIMDAFILPSLRDKLDLKEKQPRGSKAPRDQDPLSFFQ